MAEPSPWLSGDLLLLFRSGWTLWPRVRIASSGGSRPVQRSKDSAPCLTSTSRPSTTSAPPRLRPGLRRASRARRRRGRRRAAAGRSRRRGSSSIDVVRPRARPRSRSRPRRRPPAPRRSPRRAPRRARWRARACGSRRSPRRPASRSAQAAARPAPPAPSTSAVMPARRRAAARRAGPAASVLSAWIAPSSKVSVFAAPIARAASLGVVGQRERRLLVRDRHVRAAVARRRQRAHRLLEQLGRDRQLHVAPVEPERLERRVVHRRRAAVRDRVAEDAGERQQSVGDCPPCRSRSAL